MKPEEWHQLVVLIREKLPALDQIYPDAARQIRRSIRQSVAEAVEILDRMPAEPMTAAQREQREVSRAEVLAVRALLDGQDGAA